MENHTGMATATTTETVHKELGWDKKKLRSRFSPILIR